MSVTNRNREQQGGVHSRARVGKEPLPFDECD